MPCFGASLQSPPGAPSVDEEEVAFGRVEVNLGTRTLSRDGEEQALYDRRVLLVESPAAASSSAAVARQIDGDGTRPRV